MFRRTRNATGTRAAEECLKSGRVGEQEMPLA